MEIEKISNLVKGPLEKLFSSIGSEIDHIANNKLLEYQVNTYRKSCYVKTILHRSEPVRLLGVYFPIKLSCQKGAKREAIVIEGQELFKFGDYLTVSGSAGSGKSMLLKYLFLRIADEKKNIPIKIELRYLDKFQDTFEKYVWNILNFSRISKDERITERILSSGKFVFLLDGFDELNSKARYKLIKEIDQFIEKYSKNKYVITTRPYVDIELLPLFSNLHVNNLETDDIINFVKLQLPNDELEISDKIISAIELEGNENYHTFLQNPLLLSMFILTFQSYSKLPSQKHIFYSQVIDTLYNAHDSLSKLGYEREKESGLSRDEFNKILNTFSCLTLFENKLVFNKTYFRGKISQIKSKFIDLRFNNDKLLNDLLVALCILNKEGFDYSFVHKSIQEYFAAVYISKLTKANKQIVYGKLFDLFVGEKREMNIGLSNFISLLIELDYKYVYELLIFKFFDYLLSGLKEFLKEKDNRESSFDPERFVLTNLFTLNQTIGDYFEVSEQKRIRKQYDKVFSFIEIKTNQSGIEKIQKPSALTIEIKIGERYMTELEELFNSEVRRIKDNIRKERKSESDILELL